MLEPAGELVDTGHLRSHQPGTSSCKLHVVGGGRRLVDIQPLAFERLTVEVRLGAYLGTQGVPNGEQCTVAILHLVVHEVTERRDDAFLVVPRDDALERLGVHHVQQRLPLRVRSRERDAEKHRLERPRVLEQPCPSGRVELLPRDEEVDEQPQLLWSVNPVGDAGVSETTIEDLVQFRWPLDGIAHPARDPVDRRALGGSADIAGGDQVDVHNLDRQLDDLVGRTVELTLELVEETRLAEIGVVLEAALELGEPCGCEDRALGREQRAVRAQRLLDEQLCRVVEATPFCALFLHDEVTSISSRKRDGC